MTPEEQATRLIELALDELGNLHCREWELLTTVADHLELGGSVELDDKRRRQLSLSIASAGLMRWHDLWDCLTKRAGFVAMLNHANLPLVFAMLAAEGHGDRVRIIREIFERVGKRPAKVAMRRGVNELVEALQMEAREN